MKKIKLKDLNLKSFVTTLDETNSKTIGGGDSGGASANCPDYTRNINTCNKTWVYPNCSNTLPYQHPESVDCWGSREVGCQSDAEFKCNTIDDAFCKYVRTLTVPQ